MEIPVHKSNLLLQGIYIVKKIEIISQQNLEQNEDHCQSFKGKAKVIIFSVQEEEVTLDQREAKVSHGITDFPKQLNIIKITKWLFHGKRRNTQVFTHEAQPLTTLYCEVQKGQESEVLNDVMDIFNFCCNNFSLFSKKKQNGFVQMINGLPTRNN